jgi:hypothetical protein
MAILGTIGLASFVNYGRSQTMQQAVNDFTTALNTVKAASVAQAVSISVNGQSLTCLSGSFGGYGIKIIDATHYEYYIMCSGVEVYPATTIPLPPKITFAAGTTQDVFFAVLTGGVTGTGNIVFDGSGLGLAKKTISIDSGANILVPTPTP